MIWIDKHLALAIHDEQLAEHGGATGVRDLGLLESALARPQNILAYEPDSASISRLASAYVYGIASNHPFVDGNKRTALVVAFTFAERNGVIVIASEEDAALVILAVAQGEMSEPDLTEWFDRNTSLLGK